MHRLHHHLCRKFLVYHQWHKHPKHAHVHWGVLGSVVLGVALSFVILGWSEVEVSSVQIARAQAGTPTFYDDYNSGGAKAGIQTVGCTAHSFVTPTGRSSIAFKAWTTSPTCNNTNRKYPAYNPSLNLPALVMVWVKVEALSWPEAVGDRFSPLTIKEDSAEGVECLTRTVTTHIWPDGTLDIGHGIMSFRSTTARARVNQWDLHSVYLETTGTGANAQTNVTAWINNRVAVEGTTGGAFTQRGHGVIHILHAGLYGDNNDIVVYNDDFKVYTGITGGVSVAAQLVTQELADTVFGAVETQGSGASSPGRPPACVDGIDNNNDGFIDYPNDCGCNCRMDDEGIQAPAECDDGIDNDGDGRKDKGAGGDSGCSGANDEVEHNNPPTNYPEVNFVANPNSVNSGGSTRLEWTLANVSSCTKSGAWSGTTSANGSQSFNSITQQTDYILTCQGPGGTRARLATVYINPAQACGAVSSPLPKPGPGPGPITINNQPPRNLLLRYLGPTP